VKYDGHRLVAILAGGELRLISRNGYDRTAVFREPFREAGRAAAEPLATASLGITIRWPAAAFLASGE
jgi:ATP-dependent DNA ligase